MKTHNPDTLLMILLAIFLILGLFTLYNASSFKGETTFNDPLYYLKRQLLFLGVGIIGGIILYFIKLNFLKKYSLWIIILGFASMLLVFVPGLGIELNGARRWIELGNFTIQPSEFFKLALIIYLASFFSKNQAKINNFANTILPFLIIIIISSGILILQSSLGVLVITVLIAFSILFTAGVSWKNLILITVPVFILLLIFAIVEPYRFERIIAFRNPEQDIEGARYQVTQSLIGIGSGGLRGVGLGNSKQKYAFLPEAMNDTIFAIWAEETGFMGVSILLISIGLFIYQGFKIARLNREMFNKLLAGGITFWIGFQFLFNIMVNLDLLPVSGIPLPFFSYGGSSLISCLWAYALLLNVSKYSKK
ncbi:MAG TPA: putative lipid II flippase FtsW [Candidatus Paceibacterota bacterium]|jgi:cell division protein FtsW|nr:putative lipid II flippase FtsW [Candidatus Paceibacterota bacterium]HRS47745.1 putative lipid II flippase FtsW [Candidatus Paceibacterota bacterium]